MRLDVQTSRDSEMEMPQAFRLKGRCIDVAEIIDQWFGPDYRYCKLKSDDGDVYILRVVEHCSDWQLTFFASRRVLAAAALSGA